MCHDGPDLGLLISAANGMTCESILWTCYRMHRVFLSCYYPNDGDSKSTRQGKSAEPHSIACLAICTVPPIRFPIHPPVTKCSPSLQSLLHTLYLCTYCAEHWGRGCMTLTVEPTSMTRDGHSPDPCARTRNGVGCLKLS